MFRKKMAICLVQLEEKILSLYMARIRSFANRRGKFGLNKKLYRFCKVYLACWILLLNMQECKKSSLAALGYMYVLC